MPHYLQPTNSQLFMPFCRISTAAVYLPLRRGNAFAPDITPPVRAVRLGGLDSVRGAMGSVHGL